MDFVEARDDNHVIFPGRLQSCCHSLLAGWVRWTNEIGRTNSGVQSVVPSLHGPPAGADATPLREWIAKCGSGETVDVRPNSAW